MKFKTCGHSTRNVTNIRNYLDLGFFLCDWSYDRLPVECVLHLL